MQLSFLIPVLLLVALIVIAGPLLLIWALNTLVPTLAIAYTATNWFAGFVIMLTLGGARK